MKKELKRLSTALHLKTVYDFVESFAENNIEPEAGCQMLFIYLDEVLDLTFGWWKFLVDHQCWRLHKDLKHLDIRLHGIHSTASQRRAFQQAEYVLFGACVAYGLVPDRDIKRPHDIVHRLELLGKTVVERCYQDERDVKFAEELKKAITVTPADQKELAGFAALGDDAK